MHRRVDPRAEHSWDHDDLRPTGDDCVDAAPAVVDMAGVGRVHVVVVRPELAVVVAPRDRSRSLRHAVGIRRHVPRCRDFPQSRFVVAALWTTFPAVLAAISAFNYRRSAGTARTRRRRKPLRSRSAMAIEFPEASD